MYLGRNWSEKDWKKEYPGIMETIRQRDKKFYLDLCMETGREAEVLKCLQAAEHGHSYENLEHNGYFGKRLLKKYPEQIQALYWRDVHTLLRVANNKNYEAAKRCLLLLISFFRIPIVICRLESWEKCDIVNASVNGLI